MSRRPGDMSKPKALHASRPATFSPACRMPAAVYDKPSTARVFDQSQLCPKLEGYMRDVKLHGQWDEARVLSRVKEILNRHLGEPPRTFSRSEEHTSELQPRMY